MQKRKTRYNLANLPNGIRVVANAMRKSARKVPAGVMSFHTNTDLRNYLKGTSRAGDLTGDAPKCDEATRFLLNDQIAIETSDETHAIVISPAMLEFLSNQDVESIRSHQVGTEAELTDVANELLERIREAEASLHAEAAAAADQQQDEVANQQVKLSVAEALREAEEFDRKDKQTAQELNALQVELDQLSGEEPRLAAVLSTQQDQLEDYEQTVEHKVKDVTRQRERVTTLEEQLRKLRTALTRSEDELANAEQALTQLAKSLEHTRSEVLTNQERGSQVVNRISELETKRRELGPFRQEARERMKKIQRGLELLRESGVEI